VRAGEGNWIIDDFEGHAQEFISGLTGRNKSEAVALIKILEEKGNQMHGPRSKPLGDGLFELRKNQVRVFYVFRPGRRITLLGGMIKKEDKIPADVLEWLRKLQRKVLGMDSKEERGP